MSRRITLAEGEAPPTEFLIFARGKNQTTKGVFLYDAAAARSVMGAAEEWAGDLGNKYTLDYEHDQTRDDLPGYEKLDAGSFDLEDRPEGLFAVNVRWTDRAAGMITKREKRFTSPWFIFEKATGRVLRIVNVALCSIPATKQLQPLVAASATLAQETLMTDWMADLSKPEMLRYAVSYCADTLRWTQCLAPHFGERILRERIARRVLVRGRRSRGEHVRAFAVRRALLYGAPLPAEVKMLLNIAATTVMGLATYQLFVRHTAIGQLLNGRRIPVRQDAQKLQSP